MDINARLMTKDEYITTAWSGGKSAEDVKIYFITIPTHKFLHIKNYESIGYWDFWQKQSLVPEQDCEECVD